MTKTDRQKIHDKYDGRCAYCGCELSGRWHADHLEPIRRGWQYVPDEFGNRQWDSKKKDWMKVRTVDNPENDCFDNYMPSCAPCNILKNSLPLEAFRDVIAGFINSLNSHTNQYKFAKRYGLISETGASVEFYFEKLKKQTT